MLIHLVLTVIGFILLPLSAHYFVLGAANIAYNMKVPSLIIGLTIVAFATSAPELFIAIVAAIRDSGEIAVGNAIGSNIANIGLVLGITAVIVPLRVHSKILYREYPIGLAALVLTALLMLNGKLSYFDSLILLTGLLIVLFVFFRFAQKDCQQEPLATAFQKGLTQPIPSGKAWFWFIVSLVLLPLSAQMLIQGTVFFAQLFGISDLMIGLTLVAIGTSLPEVAVSISGAIKGQHDIVVGNILGSNIFNLLAVLAIPPLIQTIDINSIVLTRDMVSMLIITLLLFIVCYSFRKPGQITRWEGLLLLASYTGYLTWLIISSC